MAKQMITSRKIRLIDVAQKAGISLSAASMALADRPNISKETKRRVRQVVNGLKYTKHIKTTTLHANGKSADDPRRLGFLLIGRRLRDEVYSRILEEIMLLVRKSGDRLETMSFEDDCPENNVESLLSFVKDLNGLILSGCITLPVLASLKTVHLPAVILGQMSVENSSQPLLEAYRVLADETNMGRLAANRLLACGHRRVGFICEVLIEGLCLSHWLDGYRLGHMDAGLEIDTSLIQIAGQPYVGGEPAANVISNMKNSPTAYIIPDARTAASFVLAMRSRGHEISLNNIITGSEPFFAKSHGLADCPSIYIDLHELARAGFYLLDQLTHQWVPERISMVIAPRCHNLSLLAPPIKTKTL